MSTVLVIASSVLGVSSVSNQLVEETVIRLRSQDPQLRFIFRNLTRSPVPHLDTDAVTALRGAEPTNHAQLTALSLSNELIAELQNADLIIIGAPMYNFGIPSSLKSWFDYVLRAGITFRYTENGPEGLLNGKRALVIESRGGVYSEGQAQGMDSQEPHLRNLLAFMGITDVPFIRAENLAFGPEAREQAINNAREQIRAIIQSDVEQAA
jgi:FMN-dependent NADH-azoreductase